MRVDGVRRAAPAGPEFLRARIIGAASQIVRLRGLSALTIPAIGRMLHMSSATLYRHVDDLDEVIDEVRARAQAEMVELIDNAVGERRGREALEAFFEFQRLYAQAQPRMYEAAVRRSARPGASAAWEHDALTRAECAVLQSCGATPADAERLAWCLRAAVHGAICLEASDRLTGQHEIDESLRALVSMLEAAARSTAAVAPHRSLCAASEGAQSGEN